MDLFESFSKDPDVAPGDDQEKKEKESAIL